MSSALAARSRVNAVWADCFPIFGLVVNLSSDSTMLKGARSPSLYIESRWFRARFSKPLYEDLFAIYAAIRTQWVRVAMKYGEDRC